MGDSREERIKERAYLLWLEQGKPEGLARAHWELARAQIESEEKDERHEKRFVEKTSEQVNGVDWPRLFIRWAWWSK
jgi:hypothetical protein